MLRIESERDIEMLRQATLLLDRENRHLHRKVQDLQQRVAALEGLDAAQLQIALLRELEQLTGKATSVKPQPSDEPAVVTEPPPRRGHGPREQKQLVIQPIRHLLAEGFDACPECGRQLQEMGVVEDSEEITVVERQFVVLRNERMKYRCRCNGVVVTAPGPDKLISGGRYTPEFAVAVATEKYLDHLPLERQVRRMARLGLETTSQTLWDQIHALAKHLEPSYEALGERVLDAPVLHVDETGWPLLDSKESSPHSVFGLVTPDTAFYRIPSSKSTQAAAKVLGRYRGTAVADGYVVYEKLSRAGPFRLAHCWAHVLRRFRELEELHPQESSAILGLIGELYRIDSEVGGDDAAASARRLALRHERSRVVIAAIREWCFAQRALPRSALGKAVRYVLKYWDGLTLFLEDGRIPLDNNAVERALRGPVVGRKNHYGSKSRRGTQVAAILYSLCETAKLCGVEPQSYLIEACRRAIRSPGAITLPCAGGVISRS